MFDKEFYPTPLPVLDLMGIDAFNKVVLEPSAGKGDIVDYLKNNGAKSVLDFILHEPKELDKVAKQMATKTKIILDATIKKNSHCA